jgi:ABC-type amino acid transport substrate-binding protein
MNSLKTISILFIALLPLFSKISLAQEPTPITNKPKKEEKVFHVAIKPSEPWVMYDETLPLEQRKPIGFSIDLWQEIAKKIGVKTQWVYTANVPELLESVETGRAEVGISAITIRSDREQLVDFSTSMFELGLQIMVNADEGINAPLQVIADEVGQFITWQNFLLFSLIIFLAINLRWLVDKIDKQEPKLFPDTYWRGINQAFWWSITMLITWEAPRKTGLARTVDLAWHFTGLVAMSVLTGVIAAALTIQAVGGAIKDERDLPGKRVAAVATDAPRDYLERIGARVLPVITLDEGIQMVINGKADALVHDGPRLLYLAEKINQTGKKVLVLPAVFNEQNYGIVLSNGSRDLEKINLALLKLREPDGLDDSFHEQLKKKWIPKTN